MEGKQEPAVLQQVFPALLNSCFSKSTQCEAGDVQCHGLHLVGLVCLPQSLEQAC